MILRARLLLVIGVLAATYVVAATLIVHSLEAELIGQVDVRLESLPRAVMAQPGRVGENGQPPPDQATDPPGSDDSTDSPDNPFSDFYIAEISVDGEAQPLVVGTLDADDIDLDAIRARIGAQNHTFTIDGLHSGGRYRVLVSDVDPSRGTIVAVQSLSEADAVVQQVIRTFLIAGAILAAVILLAALWVYRLGLAPIARVTGVAKAISAGDRTRRLDIDDRTTEAGQLGQAFNLMLDERDASEARLRQFVADASHELRTPLTSIQGYLDLYQQGAFHESDQLDDVVRRMSAESSRMRAMVKDLLTLASLDEHPELRREKVDIGRLLVDAAMDARAIQPGRSISVAEPIERVTVLADASRITQLVGILVSNALGHTPPDAAIMLSCSSSPIGVTFVVRDAGPGMDAATAAHVFDRFWRGSSSRSRDRTGGREIGAGLGLAIAQAIVQAHGGAIALDSSPGGGSTFTVTLPHG